MSDDKRLIEDYLPIEAISDESAREKSTRKGHISTLHLWWARRPLVACRAAVYAALVQSSRFRPKNGPEEKRDSLGRANAAKFVQALCKYPGSEITIDQARQHILDAHAERLTEETGNIVTVEDIIDGRAPRPKVLDMFAGGGAIPFEALRLGCDAYALDLNPVAHIVELCTLVYPEKYGKPDKTVAGSAEGGTWAGLEAEVRFWGDWVLEKVKGDIGDLYPPIPDPNAPKIRQVLGNAQIEMAGNGFERKGQQKLALETPADYMTAVAYLWTRTVRCKNPACGATVPLVKQTWLCKKAGRCVALKMVAPRDEKRVSFEVVDVTNEDELGFDPTAFSKAGNATCPFCGTVADSDYVKVEGCADRIGQQLMAFVCTRSGKRGKVYVSADDLMNFIPDDQAIKQRIEDLCTSAGLSVPNEPIITDAKNANFCILYGLNNFGKLFIPRQLLCMLTFVAAVRMAEREMLKVGYQEDHQRAVATFLGLVVDRVAMFGNSLCAWYYQEQAVSGTFSRQALPMLWDFGEVSLLANISGGIAGGLTRIVEAISLAQGQAGGTACVLRGGAQDTSSLVKECDVVITDPPYYDNIPYADLSDFFYVWLRRAIGHLYPEHFASEATPKRYEAVADATRHSGDRDKARQAYEDMMRKAFVEAHRVLKPDGQMAVIYAHKTTLGWATLVDALRKASYTITEAWPVHTEGPGRLRAHNSAALASSIFLVARKRACVATGAYEEEVQPELAQIVRERVATLWEMGISGADLVIACVGAGLRAFTRFAKVDFANGEEVPAERFLTEVETVVLETILARLSKEVGGKQGLASVDPATRFYILWRYTYRSAALDAGEAIIFANGTHVELDGLRGLSSGSQPLLEKEKGTYSMLDYTERGDDKRLGMASDDGQPAPLIDALQRTLWLMEKRPGHLADFLREAQPNLEQMRLVAQALAGSALKGKSDEDKALISTTQSEQSALGKLLANWRTLVEQPTGPLFKS